MQTEQRVEVDQNYDAFQRMLATIIGAHRDQYALMHGREIVDYFVSAGDAYRAGRSRFGASPFSIQEVTDQPIDLGLWSHIRV